MALESLLSLLNAKCLDLSSPQGEHSKLAQSESAALKGGTEAELIILSLVFDRRELNIKDTQCGFKLYEKKIAKLIFLKLKDFGFSHDIELILLLKNKKIKIKELPVKWVHKKDSKLNLFWDPIKMFFGIFITKLRYL